MKENKKVAIIVDSKILLKRFVRRFLLIILGLPFLPIAWFLGKTLGHELNFVWKDWVSSWVYSWRNA